MDIKRRKIILYMIFLISFYSCNKTNVLEKNNNISNKSVIENSFTIDENDDNLPTAFVNHEYIKDFENDFFNEIKYTFEEIKDIEKIRWINCGEDNYDLPKTDKLTFSFTIIPSEKYLKIFDLEKNQYYTPGEGEEYTLAEGEFYLFYEFKNNYYVSNFTKSYYNYLLKQKDSYFITKDGYYLGQFCFHNENEYTREDTKNFSIDDLCTKYIKVNDNTLYTIVESVEEIEKYKGIISISDNNQTINVRGKHFIYYNQEKGIFCSDSLFDTKGYSFGRTGNDNFTIKVLRYDEETKLLLLDTSEITRPYVPMEDFFTPGTDKICIEKPYEDQKNNILIYSEPNFNSQIIKTFSGNETIYGKVVESKGVMEEYDGKISKWVKVQFDDGFEGWIWGRDVTLFDWSSGYDHEKVLRYVKYNIVK